MRPIREILRYHFDLNLSNKHIGLGLKVSKGSVHNTLCRFKDSGLPWPLPETLSDRELKERLYKAPSKEENPKGLPSIGYIEEELSRPHMTLKLLYEEYRETTISPVSIASFYRYYNQHKTKSVSMKNIHKGGEKLYVDYSGDSIGYIDRSTGESIKTELFVCSWGASSYSYVEVAESQKADEFTMAHVRAFEYFKGVPAALVPDNLKSAVTKVDRYDPIINRIYGEMAEHYGTAVLPARVAKPKDKAVVESNVLHVQRYILARLRNSQFFSLGEVNAAVQILLEEYNSLPMKDYGNQSRRERYLQLDFPFVSNLPVNPFEITRMAVDVPVAPNYHIRFHDHHYSVPHIHARSKVTVYQKGGIIEIYNEDGHLCRHKLGSPNYGYTTDDLHMPESHKHVKGWSPSWLIFKAGEISSEVSTTVKMILESRRHPEQAYNAAMGLIRLSKAYGNDRLTAACCRALYFRSVSYQSVKSILEKGLDKQKWCTDSTFGRTEPVVHENIRGNDYYLEREEAR